MTNKKKIEIKQYYNEDKNKWVIDEEDDNLLLLFDEVIDAVNRKYSAVTDSWHNYNFGFLSNNVVYKIEERYPGVFEPDGDYFTAPVDKDAVSAAVWSLEKFYKEVVRMNYSEIDGAESFETFKNEVYKND